MQEDLENKMDRELSVYHSIVEELHLAEEKLRSVYQLLDGNYLGVSDYVFALQQDVLQVRTSVKRLRENVNFYSGGKLSEVDSY